VNTAWICRRTKIGKILSLCVVSVWHLANMSDCVNTPLIFLFFLKATTLGTYTYVYYITHVYFYGITKIFFLNDW
jgi:hypothetical protein